MSRIKSDKISLADSIVVDFFSVEEGQEQPQENSEIISEAEVTKINLILKEAEDKAQKILEDANNKAQEIIEAAALQANDIKNKAQLEANNITEDANAILEKSKTEAESLLEQANSESVQIRENASQEGAKEGYQSGYNDGLNKIRDELLHKICAMDEVVKNTFEMKNKILSSSSKEIVELVLLIARKLLINSVDENCVAKVVNNSLSLLNDKENIELILSEKYAKLLNQVLNDDLLEQKPDLEIDIDKLKSIKLVYNSKLHDDTLIIQTLKERLDLSFTSQLDKISKEFLKELNTSFDKKDEDEVGEV